MTNIEKKNQALYVVYPILKDNFEYVSLYTADKIVTALLKKGVIFPSCKVGSKVWIPDNFGRIEAEIESIEITERGLMYEWVKYDRGPDETEVWDSGSFTDSDIGKSVFLTFQEYQKAFCGKEQP